MDEQKIKEEFTKRIQEVVEFAKEKEVAILAVQQVTKEGYIETVPLYRNLKVYPNEKIVAERVDPDTTASTPEVDLNTNKGGTSNS